MTPEEIKNLRVGDVILIGDLEAEVDMIYRAIDRKLDNGDRQYIYIFEGHYKCFENMADGGLGWITTDSPEFNNEHGFMPLKDINFKKS